MQIPELKLTEDCDYCGKTGKKWLDSRGFQVNPDHFLFSDKKKNPIKETEDRCDYCLGTRLQPSDLGIEIIEFVKTYMSVKT
jgi:hypothetical protein